MRDERMRLFEDNPEYDAFVNKFKQKKTTDDCYTPPEIYDVIKNWVCKKYHIDPESIVRPFYPGGDYENYEYPDDCLVLDNPPFSIFSKICEFYIIRGIRFFLFAPALTCFSGKNTSMKMNHIICDTQIVYENGANVKTSFVTNLDDGIIAQTAPDLSEKINNVSKKIKKTKTLPKYKYPDNVVTATMLQKYCGKGISLSIRKESCVRITKLDEQKALKKEIFGGGLLLSEKAAAEKAAAEKAAAEKTVVIQWKLSKREKEIVKSLR